MSALVHVSAEKPGDIGSADDAGDTTIIACQIVPQAGTGVLIVDDDPIVLEHLTQLISAAGFEVACATSSQDALTMLEKHFRPIVIVDRNMPGLDGHELCRELRGRVWPGYLYTLLLTGEDAEKDVLEGLEAGADDYLSKQTSNAQLLVRMRNAQRILSLEQSLGHMAEERRRLAMTDPLTGAASRRYLMRYLVRELQRALRRAGDLTVLIVDVDNFKRVNDTHGPAAGDAVLIELVQRIRDSLPREYDWCARLGGEEFVVVLPQDGLDAALVVGERVRTSVARRAFQAGGAQLDVTVSIGAASLSGLAAPETRNVDGLLAVADECLYRSKESGRNRMTVPGSGA